MAHVVEDAHRLELGVDLLGDVALVDLLHHIGAVLGERSRGCEEPAVGVDDDEGVAEDLVHLVGEALDVVGAAERRVEALALEVEMHMALGQPREQRAEPVVAARCGAQNRAVADLRPALGEVLPAEDEREANLALGWRGRVLGGEGQELFERDGEVAGGEREDLLLEVDLPAIDVGGHAQLVENGPQLHG